MQDTIELLEAVGRDASLRYAAPEDLARALELAQASEPLVAAVSSGDSSQLVREFGSTPAEPPQSTQAPFREEEEPEEEEPEIPAPLRRKPS